MSTITFHVTGTPAEQGSMSPRPIRTGSAKAGTQRITGMRVTHSNPTKLHPWRNAIITAAHKYMTDNPHINWPLTEPIDAKFHVYLDRPKNHYRTGRYQDMLKPGAPRRPHLKHDYDKLARAISDALTMSGMIQDDGLIVSGRLAKYWADNTQPGATITLRPTHDLELN